MEGYYSFGFNDNVCTPTSIYSALNVIDAKKEIVFQGDRERFRGVAPIHKVNNNWGIGPIRLDVGTPATGDDAFSSVEVYIGIGQAF